MDEMPVWSNMFSDATVDKTGAWIVTMKSTGHEKYQACLITKAGGTKLKPFNVFNDAKRDLKYLNDELKACCGIVSSSNCSMKNDFDN